MKTRRPLPSGAAALTRSSSEVSPARGTPPIKYPANGSGLRAITFATNRPPIEWPDRTDLFGSTG